MKYLYVAATEEVEREALAAVTARVAAEFGGPVRSMELGSVDFAYDAERRQYGSIPVLDMLLRRCPEDAAKLLAVTERDLFIPVLTFVFRTGATGRPGGRGLLRPPPAGVLWARGQPRNFSGAGLQRSSPRDRPSVRPGALRGTQVRDVARHYRPPDRYERRRILRACAHAVRRNPEGTRV